MLMHQYLITVGGMVDAGGIRLRPSMQHIRHATAAKGVALLKELEDVAREAFPRNKENVTILNVFDCGEDEFPDP